MVTAVVVAEAVVVVLVARIIWVIMAGSFMCQISNFCNRAGLHRQLYHGGLMFLTLVLQLGVRWILMDVLAVMIGL